MFAQTESAVNSLFACLAEPYRSYMTSWAQRPGPISVLLSNKCRQIVGTWASDGDVVILVQISCIHFAVNP